MYSIWEVFNGDAVALVSLTNGQTSLGLTLFLLPVRPTVTFYMALRVPTKSIPRQLDWDLLRHAVPKISFIISVTYRFVTFRWLYLKFLLHPYLVLATNNFAFVSAFMSFSAKSL